MQRFPFSRHSSYKELRCLVQALRPKDIYPCTVSSSTWSAEVSMKTLFGDLCSADLFSHDARMYELRKEVVVGDGGSDSTQESEVSQHTTPSQKRRMSAARRGSDASITFPTSVKKTKIALSSPSKPPKTVNLGIATLQPSGTESFAEGSSNIRSTAATSTATRATPTPEESVRDRVSRRVKIAEGVQHGTPWRGLQSVHGYHNESSEEEL